MLFVIAGAGLIAIITVWVLYKKGKISLFKMKYNPINNVNIDSGRQMTLVDHTADGMVRESNRDFSTPIDPEMSNFKSVDFSSTAKKLIDDEDRE